MASDVFGLVGTTVSGAFRVEAVVAEGGFAVVYRAYHEGFRALVALKCLKIPQYMSDDQRQRFEQQFQAEAELLFKLSASIPNVVRPLHVEAVVAPDGSFMPFLALEWLEGETLDAVAKRRRDAGQPPFTLAELVPALTPVARALERAHNFIGPDGPISIVHRDMKPENVFVARVAGESIVKILDFGIGKAKSMASQVAGRASQDDAGLSPFTPAYGAPEQWLPKRFGQTGPWTDVWGLALTLVELMAGRPVVDGNQSAMMGTVLDPERRPTPRSEGVQVGDAVELVFAHTLALDPRDRYRHAGEFWTALLAAGSADLRKSRPGGSGAYRAAGRSGGYPAVAGPASSSLGRHNLIPDLEPPRAAPAPAIELELELSEPARPAARSGQWQVSAPAAESIEADLPLEPASSSYRPPPSAGGGSGRFPAMRSAGSTPPPASGVVAPVDATPRPSSPPRASRPPVSVAPPQGPPSPVPRGPLLHPEAPRSEEPWRRFIAPTGLVAAGIAVTVVDGALAASSGEVFTLGFLRLGWVAAALALGGIGLAVYRLLGAEQ